MSDHQVIDDVGRVKHQPESNAAFEAVVGPPRVGGSTNKIQVVTAGGH